jgi:hypothetical protein
VVTPRKRPAAVPLKPRSASRNFGIQKDRPPMENVIRVRPTVQIQNWALEARALRPSPKGTLCASASSIAPRCGSGSQKADSARRMPGAPPMKKAACQPQRSPTKPPSTKPAAAPKGMVA